MMSFNKSSHLTLQDQQAFLEHSLVGGETNPCVMASAHITPFYHDLFFRLERILECSCQQYNLIEFRLKYVWYLLMHLKVKNNKDSDFAADVHVFAAKISPLIL